MVYGCGNQFIKCLLFTTNLLIFVLGGLIFSISLWVKLDFENFKKIIESIFEYGVFIKTFVNELIKLKPTLWVFIFFGALLFLVGFLGCCGAVCENVVSLTLFFVIVLVLFFIQILTLIFIYTNREILFSSLQKVLQEHEGSENFTSLEKTLMCCFNVTAKNCNSNNLHNEPNCYDVISKKLEIYSKIIPVIATIALTIQAFLMVFSVLLCRAFHKRRTYYYD